MMTNEMLARFAIGWVIGCAAGVVVLRIVLNWADRRFRPRRWMPDA